MSELTNYDQLRENPSAFVSTACGVEPFDYQQEFLDADARHRVIASGRQVGKSRMCAWLALHWAMTNAHAQILITAPSLRQSSLLFDTLYAEIDQSGLSDADWGIERDTQTIIEFDNGSSIHCLPTGRNGNKIRGFTADMVIVDEAAFIENAIFEDILQPMLFASGGRMVLASTPWGKGGFLYKKFSQAETDDGWARTQVSSSENPLVDEGDLEEYKEGKTSSQIKREVRGEFVDDSGQFFPTDAIQACMPGGSPARDQPKAYLGVDIAGSGDDRTVFYGVDEAGNVFLNDEVHEDMGVLEAARYTETLDDIHDFTSINVDRTAIGTGTVEALSENPQLARKLNQVYFSIQKKQQIYQRLKAAFEDGALYLPHDTELVRELESITENKTQAGNLRLQPRNNGKDDMVDALALAVWGLPEFGKDANRQRGATQPVTARTQNARKRGRRKTRRVNTRSRTRRR